MGNILENIGQIHVAVVKDKETRESKLAQALSALAVKAIMGGLGSPDWREYMSIFADNEAQLSVLCEVQPDEPEDSYLPQSRAYIVSNAVCSAGTNTATTNNVDRAIAKAVTNNAAEEVTLNKRPAHIKALLAGLV
jgi:hypothetical protein